MILIRTGRLRLLALLLGSAVFVALGFWFILFPPATLAVGPHMLVAIGLASVLFFGLCGGILLKRFLSHRIALVLDRRGVLDNSTATPAGFVDWNEILSTGIVTTSGVKFVGIDVRDREALYERSPRGRMLRTNADLHQYPVLIPEVTLDRKPEELQQLIDRYRSDKPAREQLGVLDVDDFTSSRA